MLFKKLGNHFPNYYFVINHDEVQVKSTHQPVCLIHTTERMWGIKGVLVWVGGVKEALFEEKNKTRSLLLQLVGEIVHALGT